MIAALIEAARDLAEAVESMQATFGCIQGKTPEDDDLHIHEKWAEEFIAERLATLRNALAAAEAQPTGDLVVTKNDAGQIVAVTRQDVDGRILEVLAEAQPAAQPLTDEQLLSIARAEAGGTGIKLTRDVGPYEVTEPTHVYKCIVRAIERAHGIGSKP